MHEFLKEKSILFTGMLFLCLIGKFYNSRITMKYPSIATNLRPAVVPAAAAALMVAVARVLP
jgi:hypothetical protein